METLDGNIILTVKVLKGLDCIEKDNMDKICNRIRLALCMGQITRIKLAGDIGVSRDRVFDYLNPNYPEASMNVDVLKRMAEYFHKDQYYFCNSYHLFLDSGISFQILKEKRIQMKLTQKEYSEILGVKQAIYKKYEQGQARIPENVWKQIME